MMFFLIGLLQIVLIITAGRMGRLCSGMCRVADTKNPKPRNLGFLLGLIIQALKRWNNRAFVFFGDKRFNRWAV
jgi:hypothetical protein